MNVLTRLVLDHKRLVVAFWLVVTLASFGAIGPAGNALSQQFNVPGREGFETNQDMAAIYGNGGDVAPLVPVVSLPQGTTVDSPGVREQLDAALARIEAALPEARTASYASTGDRAFVSADGRTTFALVYIPAVGGVDPGQDEARKAQAALAGVTVGGSPVEVTGLDALRAGASGSGSGASALLETVAAMLGALLILVFVFRSFMAIVPLLMALVAIPTTFLLVWPLATVTDVSVIVKFLVALIGLGIAIDYAMLIVARWREEPRPRLRRRRPQEGKGVPRRVAPGGSVGVHLVLAWAVAHVGRFSYNLGPPTDRGGSVQDMQSREPSGSTCDCSMFARWAFAQAGVDIGGTTSVQWVANGLLPSGNSAQKTPFVARV